MIPKNPFDPSDAARSVADEPVNKPTPKPKPVHHAAIPNGSKKVTTPIKQAAITPVGAFPPPGDPYWKEHPLLTEHKDGTVRQWGEDTTAIKNPNVLPKQMLPQQSDKANGTSSRYYPTTEQNKSKALPEIKSENYR